MREFVEQGVPGRRVLLMQQDGQLFPALFRLSRRIDTFQVLRAHRARARLQLTRSLALESCRSPSDSSTRSLVQELPDVFRGKYFNLSGDVRGAARC